MTTLLWITLSGLLMSAIALVGSVTLLLKEATLQRILLPLVAFAAGSLIGGAFLHMIPASLAEDQGGIAVYLWILAGFTLFFALEQFLHWHHCHRAAAACKEPLTYLILIGDGLHNFYIGASDLVPEVSKHQDVTANLIHFVCFVVGLALMLAIRMALHG
jgi:zinc and cadmium transporter